MKTQKTKMRHYVLVVILIGLFNQSFATNAILKGKVIDKQTKISLPMVNVYLKSETGKTIKSTLTDVDGKFEITGIAPSTYNVIVEMIGYRNFTKKGIVLNSSATKNMVFELTSNTPQIVEEIDVVDAEDAKEESISTVSVSRDKYKKDRAAKSAEYSAGYASPMMIGNVVSRQDNFNTESYSSISENDFKNVIASPLSTFSIDVDAASYSNMRRFITNGQNPPADAVRIEEMINYFSYDYPQPKGEHPFSITTEMSDCPWNKNNKLIHIGLQGKKMDMSELPSSNLVFLLDVSGSMSSPNKLPLLKKSFNLLVNNLSENDRVAIVVYAGAAGLVLPSTPGNDKEKIMEALNNLNAGGSTAGGAGIKLAYKIAQENFIKEGNNRIILATDGDFNIGASSDGEMTRLIEEKRKSGVYLTCLGFGMGNYKDSKMETLADKGNGNYAYIDNILEAKKVLVTEMGGTMFTIAKDVKLQLEFNPEKIESYKLIGYENRLLNDEDFNDDTKDAGELGAGHTVTALYEVVLKGQGTAPSVDPLRYQKLTELIPTPSTDEILTVKFRYKKPTEDKSNLIVNHLMDKPVALNKTSDNFRFSAAVAEFGLLLRNSKHKAEASFEKVLELAKNSKGKDEFGYRAEFIRLVEMSEMQASAFLNEE
ncbi:MAG: von Willebrand factor type A domain-containing protein [Flavobacteriales bacterium]|nr:von Willebrand factor type A domain-containing protein [Flavobacteriales bacterium]